MDKNLIDPADELEMMSMLADGQLDDARMLAALELYESSPEARRAWLECHLIGDAMRSVHPVSSSSCEAFVLGWRARLAEASPRHAEEPVSLVRQDVSRPEPANDSAYRWRWVAVAASVVAVVAVSWSVFGVNRAEQNAIGQMASVSPGRTEVMVPKQPAAAPVVVVAGPQGNVIRDPRLQEILAAHKQLGGASALHTPAGFLRNATFDPPSSR